MKKSKQKMLIGSYFDRFKKIMYRMVDVNDSKPVKINDEKDQWKMFGSLEEIVDYYKLKNVTLLDKSNDIDDMLWWTSKENKDIFYLVDVEGRNYKKGEVDNTDSYVEYLDILLKGNGWKDGFNNYFDSNGNFEYRIDHYTGLKSSEMMTEENTVYDETLRRSVLKSELKSEQSKNIKYQYNLKLRLWQEIKQ